MALPKRGPDGKYIDDYTTTPEEAAQFERTYNTELPDPPDCEQDLASPGPSDWWLWYALGDSTYRETRCSNPNCTCKVARRGTP